MKKETTSLFGNLFGGKSDSSESEKSKPVVITSYSQPNVLQQRMKEEKLTHGETVTANLSPVRLENAYGKMVMYFCPMKNIEVLETVTNGDGENIPAEAKVEGLTIPDNLKAGFYNLKNVMLTSNGTMQVKATNKTFWEKAELEQL
ncbi:hypothetical protein [Segetibacter koreensis]|uniref:hypothetical protein n=1 Tax=Segetibacter koreensis TaxID=398037 RepID=UPI0003700D0F|nr:hypothetical protein [Segetibacter koreensis]